MSGARSTVGIYGGTFNPVHLGHLRAAEEVLEALALERMLFVPSGQPPHKGGREDTIAPAAERLEWVRLATEDNPRFGVESLEIERAGRSFLVDTLRTLGRRLSPALPVFTLGRDAFAEMDAWREPEHLLRLAHYAVTTRPPERGTLRDWMPECARSAFALSRDGRSARHREAGTWIRFLEITALDVSASEIRARIRAGRSVRYLLPERVRERVLASGVYAQAGRQEERIA
jgi:nicotinate-nucleotide adenylyltransferase